MRNFSLNERYISVIYKKYVDKFQVPMKLHLGYQKEDQREK